MATPLGLFPFLEADGYSRDNRDQRVRSESQTTCASPIELFAINTSIVHASNLERRESTAHKQCVRIESMGIDMFEDNY